MRKKLTALFLSSLVTLVGCTKVAPPPTPEATKPPEPGHVTHTIQAVVQPPIGHGPMTAATFMDSARGLIALGQTILATTDGGKHWLPLSETPAPVKALDFTSADQGWATTDTGLISTTDGGKTWQAVETEATNFTRIDFVDASHAFAEAQGEFVRTIDGGGTWIPANAPCGADLSPQRLFHFLSNSTGWFLCGGQPATAMQVKSLYRTTDGGRTWRLISSAAPNTEGGLPLSGHVTDLFFRDAAKGWLTESRGTVLQTSDGGRTWKTLNMPQPDGFWSTPRPMSDQNGFVIASASGSPALLATMDGGRTWEPRYPVAVLRAGAQFPTPAVGYAPGGPNEPGAVLKTVDGGVTWSRMSVMEGAATVVDLSFPDITHGWAVVETAGETGSMQRHLVGTTDGGKTWVKLQTAPADNKEQYATVSFVDAYTGYLATGWGHLYLSRDGGASFQAVDLQDSRAAQVRFLSAEKGFRISEQQRLQVSQDSGKNWRDVLSDYHVSAYQLLPGGLLWLDAQACSSGTWDCTKPVLLRSEDAGKSWVRYDLGLPGPMGTVFADAQHGWAQDRQTLYTTADGGATWAPAP